MSTHQPRRGLTPERQVIEFAICLVVTVLLFRTWHIENFVVPSGSMATTLLGVHRSITCVDCNYHFDCGSGEVDGYPVEEARAICPNCGCRENPLGTLTDIAGDRLLVAKQAFRFRPPRRWEVAVFRRSDIHDKVFVKRIAGLPGEKVQIVDGDVYVDDQIQRKALVEQHAVAILVHDSNFEPRGLDGATDQWRSDQQQTIWRREANRFFHPAEQLPVQQRPSGDSQQAPIDWLTFRNLRPAPSARGELSEQPVEDDLGYNQTRPVEEPSTVVDLMLSCRVRSFGRGSLKLFATDGRDQFLIHIDPHGREIALEQNGRQVVTRAIDLPSALFTRATQLELSLFDRQVLLAFDGEAVFPPHPIAASQLPRTPTSRPLAIGSQGLGLEISDLRVFRDTYYTHPRGILSRWALDEPYQLGNDEYFMLGDNSPLSEDSRFWPGGPAVRASLLVGKPLVVHLPSRQANWGWGPFNVPDFSAIRYIR